jgi:CheY-like chemotaxis protein
MATRIVHFGLDEHAIVSTLANRGYDVDECGYSISKLNDALHREESSALALEEDGVPLGEEIVTSVRSVSPLPLILFQDGTRTYDSSIFDLVIPLGTPTKDWLSKVAQLIERSRAICTETKIASERHRSLMQESASLVEASVAVHFESQLALAKRKDSAIDPVRIGAVLIVDDYAPWRQRVCSMLRHYAEAEISESADGIEAVGKAHELKPDLILLDLQLPRLNGIEAAIQIGEVAPDATILFVSMNKDADVVREALKTGAKGYVLKTDAATELWPAIRSVLQRMEYVSRSARPTPKHER